MYGQCTHKHLPVKCTVKFVVGGTQVLGNTGVAISLNWQSRERCVVRHCGMNEGAAIERLARCRVIPRAASAAAPALRAHTSA